MIKRNLKLATLFLLIFSFALASCSNDGKGVSSSSTNKWSDILSNISDSDDNSTSTHEHTFSSSYEYDDTYHWHPSTCGHDVQGDKEKHKFTTSITNPTYEKGGYTTYTCLVCGYSYIDNKTDALPITITWKNYDGTILEVDKNVTYGSIPSYDGSTPIRESDGVNNYYFIGWTPEVKKATESTTYTATFTDEEITYTIDFDLNGGTSNSYKGPIEVKTFSKDMFFFDCVKEDWSFRGWEYKGEKIFDENGNQLKNITLVDNMVFKAIYSQTVKLSIVSNIPGAGTITGDGEYPYNTYVDVSVKPNQGYVFIGWYYQDTLLSNTEDYKYMMWDQDITLEARFQLDSFTMHVYSNSEDLGLVLLRSNINNNYLTEYSEQRKYTSEVTIAAYSKTDVRFLGWYDENNELVTTNAVYTFVMPNHDYTLEAKWNYFKINYNLNGGTNSENNPEYFDIDDNEIILSNPTRDDKDFVGWKYNGELIDKIDSSIINNGKDITLEAVWSNYTYSILEDDNGDKYISITGWENPSEELVILETLNINGENIPIKEIGANAFKDNKKLKSVTIPNNITRIGSSAFSGCINLETINISENSHLEIIGDSAFYNCELLNFINIPNCVQTISDSAFSGCSSLTSIIINNSVTTIGNYAFSECSNLTIYCKFASKPSTWKSNWNYSNCPVIWSCEGGGIYSGLRYTIYEENNKLFITITDYLGTDQNVIIPSTISIGNEDIPVTSIDEKAFYNCNSLVSITIPDSVTMIGDSAFYGCSSLTSITISDSVTTIGSQAFNGCSSITIYCEAASKPSGWSSSWNSSYRPVVWNSLGGGIYNEFKYVILIDDNDEPYIEITDYLGSDNENVIIPNVINIGNKNISVTSIGREAFSNSSLSSIIIPNNITAIGYYAFSNCTNLESITFEENSQLTAIGEYVFSGCTSLISIIIPDSITSIESDAFSGCTNLESIIFGENSQLQIIGDYAFSNCSSLTSITIPDSVTSIGSDAFRGCSSLTSIIIPNSIISIGSSAFANCSSITIYCEAASKPSGWNSSWNSSNRPVVWNCLDARITDDGFVYHVYINEEGDKYIIIDTFIGVSSEINIPDVINVDGENIKVTIIADYAFANNNRIKSISIGNNVTTIGSSAFRNCFYLTSIFISNSVTSIGNYAFYDCANLKSITFGENSQLKTIGEYAFSSWSSSLTSITIPNSVISIGNYAFYRCTNLESITFGENSQLQTVGEHAFYGCSSLTSITIPDSVTSIGSDAFRGCANLKSITFGENSQLKTIGEYAFYGCSSLTSIIIPSSVTSIGSYAFADCSSITIYCEASSKPSGWDFNTSRPVVWVGDDIVIKGDFAYVIRIDGIEQYIEIVRYLGNSNYVTISKTIEICGQEIPIKVIGSYAFNGCANLKSITFEENSQLQIIGEYAFYECSKLESIIFGENSQLQKIGSYAFRGCSSLTSIIIPNSVTSIGSYAFNGCVNLKSITFGENSQLKTIGEYAFYECSKLESIIFGENSQLQKIESYAFWYCSSLTSIIIPSSVTSIGSDAFRGCSKLESITFEENSQLQTIGSYAFWYCSSLTSITIPDSVTSIGSDAFSGCANLKSITFEENSQLQTIGEYAFYECSKLESIIFGENSQLKTIGEYAFYGCSSLISIIIPNTVTTIEKYAFYNCSDLTVYCEASSKPSGWSSYWNITANGTYPSKCRVVWGYKG